MHTKESYRHYLKSEIITKKKIWHEQCFNKSNAIFSHSPVCFADKYLAKEILTLIKSYNKPQSYKYYKKNNLFYIKTNKATYRILMYCALPFEVHLDCIIKQLRKDKKYHILVPKVAKNDFKMVKFHLPLVKNSFSIREPQSKKIERHTLIDIALVPVLGVDRELKRIGFGKGMYDRFYAQLKIKPYSIFVSRKQFISPLSLCQSHDIQADVYVSTI